MRSPSLKLAALHSFQFSAMQLSVTFLLLSDFDQIRDILHCLIRACIKDTPVFNVAVPLLGTNVRFFFYHDT